MKADPPRRGFRLVRPYSTLAGAKAALDNGGRFYHLLARSGDERVAKSELAKAAGVMFDEKGAFVFLDMALAKLSAEEKSQVVAMLGSRQAKRYRERGPRTVSATAAAREPAGATLIVEGVPRFLREITVLQAGMIMVGKVTVPVTHQWPHDLYELRERGSASISTLALAVWHHTGRLDAVPTRFGGLLALHRVKAARGETKERMLLPSYYTPLEGSRSS